MLSLFILKTIFYSGDIFFNSGKSLSFIMAILSATYFYSGNIIIPEPLKYLVFYDRDTFIKLSLL